MISPVSHKISNPAIKAFALSLYFCDIDIKNFGKIKIAFDENYLYQLSLPSELLKYKPFFDKLIHNTNHKIAITIKECLKNYFAKKPYNFNNIPINFVGTDFQKQVFNALCKISSGATTSYSKFANTYFTNNQLRAVSGQIGKNPLTIIVPCHRVIAKNNTLYNYAGGLDIKQYLLNLEH
jgi:methylated-DNA-[protein]-cysteine S-methyltransferase